MKTNLLIALVIGLLSYGLTLYFNHNDRPNMITQPDASELIKPLPGMPAPDFTFTALDGTPRKLSDFKGKTVILNFWASWCAPCIKEFPALINLATSEKDVILIALSSDYDVNAMDRFLEKMKKNGLDIKRNNIFIALDEDGRITGPLYKTYSLPETYIIDSGQKLVQKLVGADWEEDDLKKTLADL